MRLSKVMTLKQGEAVLRIVRHYGLTVAPRAFFAFALLAAPLFFMVPLFSVRPYGSAAFAVALFAGLLYGLRTFYEWYWNAFVVTTKRVIDVDQRGFFRRTVSEAPFDNIQDVSYQVHGVFGTVFGFGTVVVQTAGSQVNLELPCVKDPKDLQHLITETAGAQRTKSNGGTRSEKVAHLLDAAADLSDAEARAFLVAIQEAVSASSGPEVSVRSIEGIDEIMADTDEEQEGDPSRPETAA